MRFIGLKISYVLYMRCSYTTLHLHYLSIIRAKQRAWALVWGSCISDLGSVLFTVFYRTSLCTEFKPFPFFVDVATRGKSV